MTSIICVRRPVRADLLHAGGDAAGVPPGVGHHRLRAHRHVVLRPAVRPGSVARTRSASRTSPPAPRGGRRALDALCRLAVQRRVVGGRRLRHHPAAHRDPLQQACTWPARNLKPESFKPRACSRSRSTASGGSPRCVVVSARRASGRGRTIPSRPTTSPRSGGTGARRGEDELGIDGNGLYRYVDLGERLPARQYPKAAAEGVRLPRRHGHDLREAAAAGPRGRATRRPPRRRRTCC